MRHTHVHDLLTDPALSPEAAFCHISYALLRTESDLGRVVATRFPSDAVLQEGDLLQSRLRLSDEAVSYLVRPGGRDVPLFCRSDAGLGLLVKRYHAALGLGLYLHIHCDPHAAARLLSAGALGDPSGAAFRISRRVLEEGAETPRHGDEATYAVLAEVFGAVQSVRDGLFFRTAYAAEEGYFGLDRRADGGRFHDGVCCTLTDIAETVHRMAAFVGCGVDCRFADEVRAARVPIHRPLLLEGLLLYLLTEVRRHAVDHRAVVGIGVARREQDPRFGGRVEGRLCLSLSYPIDTLHMTGSVRTRLSETRMALADAAWNAGVDLGFPPLIPPDLRAIGSHKREDTWQRTPITLAWLNDPSVLPSGDLKHPTGLDLGEDVWEF